MDSERSIQKAWIRCGVDRGRKGRCQGELAGFCLEQMGGPIDCYGKVWRKIGDGQKNQQIPLEYSMKFEMPVKEPSGYVQYVLDS